MTAGKLKVMVVVGTRPEIIRLSRVISAIDRHHDCVLVHTGQNYDYELNEIFFEDLQLRKPDLFLEAAGDSAAQAIGNIISKCDVALEKYTPDALLILGDTNSCLSALAAKRRKVPVFHMEAGNRCFDQRVPEEINRKIVDHISDVNLTYSDIAREYLLREGLPPDLVIKTGSPMFEVIEHYKPKIMSSRVLRELALNTGGYFVVSAHREENIEPDFQFGMLVEAIKSLHEKYRVPVIVSTHPRTRKRFESAGVKFTDSIRLLKPLSFTDYVSLQINAKAVLSDSGTISEEASILDIPAVNIREAHERPEGMEEAAVVMTGLRPQRILQGIELAIAQKERAGNNRSFQLVADYAMPNVSEKVARILLSYTDYVKRVVWSSPANAEQSTIGFDV